MQAVCRLPVILVLGTRDLFIPNCLLAQNCVIPAQAGIQQEQTYRVADKTAMLSRLAGDFFHLDSRLRGNDGLMNYLGL
jgi:hypothetical protein